MRISRLAVATLAVALLVGGFALGTVATAIQSELVPRRTPSPSLAALPSMQQSLPVVDADGSDFADLPRYPGAVRTRYDGRVDGAGSAAHIEYLAVGSVEEVSSFYRQAFADHGWTVVDLQLSYGELVFLIADESRNGVVDIETRGGGVIEIDLEITTPTPSTSASPVQPTASPIASSPAPIPTLDDVDDDDAVDG